MESPLVRLALAAHLLRLLADERAAERPLGVDEMAEALGVSPAEVRQSLHELQRDGFVDTAACRLTGEGASFGGLLARQRLVSLDAARARVCRQAA